MLRKLICEIIKERLVFNRKKASYNYCNRNDITNVYDLILQLLPTVTGHDIVFGVLNKITFESNTDTTIEVVLLVLFSQITKVI